MKNVSIAFLCATLIVGSVLATPSERDPFVNFFSVLTQSDLPKREQKQGSEQAGIHDITDLRDNVDWGNSPKGGIFYFPNEHDLKPAKLPIICAQKPLKDAISEADHYAKHTQPDPEVKNPPFWLPHEVQSAARAHVTDLEGDIRNCMMKLNTVDYELSVGLYSLCQKEMEALFNSAERVELTKGMSQGGDGTPIPFLIASGLEAYRTVQHENGILLGAYCHQKHNLGAGIGFTAWFLPNQP